MSINKILKLRKLFLFIFLILSFFNNFVNAELIRPKQFGSEKRFKTWTYNPNGIYFFEVHYMYPTYIEFDSKETISTIYSPKPTAWQFVPVQNRLFVKAIQENANTTLTVMTNLRVYFFELHAKYANGPFDPEITFFVKFRYPYQNPNSQKTPGGEENMIIQYLTNDIPDLTKPEKFNFNYTVSGDTNITPVKIFDDGNLVYMEFRAKSSVLPAVFRVDNSGYESIVNFRMIGPYLAVEGVSPLYTLKYGPETVCIFNENLRSQIPKIEKKWWQFS